MAESNEIRYEIKADVSGSQKIERFTDELREQKDAVESVGKASESAKQLVERFTDSIEDAGKVGDTFKKISDRFSDSKTWKAVSAGLDIEPASKLKGGTLMNKMSPEQAGQLADQTSKLDLLERKANDARETLAKLYSEGATGSRLTRAIESAQKAQAAYNAELKKTYSHEGHQVANVITPDQASELANQIGEIQRLSTNLDYAKQKFADFSNQRLLGDDSAETAKRIADWATKIQKLEGQLASAISANNQFASGASNVASQAEAAAEGVNEYASATARIGQATIGSPEEQLALPAPSYLGNGAADEVVRKFQEVPSVFDRIAGSVEMARSAVSDFAESSGISSAIDGATASVLGFTSALDTMQGRGKKAHSLLEKIVSSFKRILFYRIVRTIIREIGQAFGEGINNLYQWSKALGGQFAQSMDQAATASLYLKNSLGAMLAPAINALVPILDVAIDAFVRFINVINQLIALVTGATSWTKAKKYPTEYAKAVTSGAGKAADALHKLGLAQIDELTILDKNHGNKGGGGGGGNALDYSQMFEQVDSFNKKLQDLVGKMKINFNDVLFKWDNLSPQDIAKKAIAGLGAFLGGAAGFIIGGVPGAIIGTLLGGTLGLMIDSLIFDNDGQLSRQEIGEMVRAALFTLTGGIIGFAVGGPGGALIGATIGLGIYGGIKAFEFFNDASADDFMSKLTPILGLISGGVIGAKIGGVPGAVIGAVLGLSLGFAIEDFAFGDTSGWSTGDWIIAIVRALAPTAGAAIGFALGGVPGAVVGAALGMGLSFTLDGFSFEDMAKWTAEDWASAVVKCLAPAAGALIGFTVGGIPGALIGLAIGLGVNFLLDTDLNSKVNDYGTTLNNTVKGHVETAQKNMALGTSSIETDVNTKWGNIVTDTDKQFGNVGTSIARKMGTANTNASNGASDVQKTLDQKWTDIDKSTGISWDGIVKTIGDKIEAAKKKLDFKWSFPKLELPHVPVPHFSWTTGIAGIQIPKFDGWWAQGGFPSAGSLFIANEAGPEMVGTMGGRTAVANNDQIVEGIAQGVYEAVRSAMGDGSQAVNVYLDGKQISGSVVKNINSETRRTGSSPLLSY